jgi:ferredoxin
MKYLKAYEEKCIGCNTCMTVCAQLYFKENNVDKSAIQILSLGQDNFGINACNQCQTCVAECPTMALSINKQGVIMINKNLCIGCFACVAICPTDSMRRYHGGVTPFKCIACGACAKECPADALAIITEEK